MNSKRTTELLRHAARRASQHPFFLAADLEQFRVHRGIQETDLARFLGCSPEVLPKVALCRRPDPESPRFRSDTHRIANFFDLQTDHLVQLIREVDVLKALREASPAAEQEVARGFLVAARDVEIAESANEETPDEGGNGEEEER